MIEELKQRMIAKSAKIRSLNGELSNSDKIDFLKWIKREYTQNLTEEEKDQLLFRIQKKANNFGVISGALEENTIERQNG